MKMRTIDLVVLFIIFALAFILAGCDSADTKSFKPSADWSRGVSIESDATGSARIAVGGQDGHTHLVNSITTENGMQIHYTQMDETANKVADVDLTLPTVQIRIPGIVMAGNDGLHLAWLGRQAGGEDWELLHVILSSNGSIVGDVNHLSEEGTNVGRFAMAGYQDGEVAFVWDDRDAGGIYGVQVSQSGNLNTRPQFLAESGHFPSIKADMESRLHMTWLDGAGIYYSLFEHGNLYPVEGTRIATPSSGTGVLFEDLKIGLSENWVYAFWTINNLSGLEAGTAYTDFVSFQSQNLPASLTAPERIIIGSSREQSYSGYDSVYNITQLVLPGTDRFYSSFVQQPTPSDGEWPELAVALSATLQYRQDDVQQIVVALFESGQYKGYSIASKTAAISADSALAVDAGGNLHVSWREGRGSAEIFYATTSYDAMVILDKVDANDVFSAILIGSMDSAASILLFPVFGLGWMLPGLLILIIWKRIQDFETLQDTSSRIVLVVAMIVYMSVKVISFPTILTYLPFSAWIEIPVGISTSIQWGVPVIIFVIAVFVANWTRRKYKDSTLIFYTGLTATDAILTLALYGVSFFTAG